MFWKKKQAAVVPVGVGSTAAPPGETTVPPTTPTTAEVAKAKLEKLPGPKDINEMVGGHIVTEKNQNPDYVWRLKSVTRRWPENKNRFYFRVFDEMETSNKKVKVHNYYSLDSHPELILWEGWADKEANTVTFQDKKA